MPMVNLVWKKLRKISFKLEDVPYTSPKNKLLISRKFKRSRIKKDHKKVNVILVSDLNNTHKEKCVLFNSGQKMAAWLLLTFSIIKLVLFIPLSCIESTDV